MPEYPDNSHSGREAAGPPKKKVTKVITGTAKTRKKSKTQKLVNAFLPEDIASVKSYILKDVIIPNIKYAAADALSVMLFGETGHIGGRRSSGSKVSYNRYYEEKRDDRRSYGRPRAPVGGFDYDDIVFETYGDAELVLDQLEAAINQYGLASVLDLYDLAGVTPPGYVSNNYGWTDIRSAKIIRDRDDYILQLPRTVQIK